MYRFVVFITAIIFCSFVHAQNLDATLSVYGQKYQNEKAYLHYDKAVYYPGETVWFKAYLIENIFPVTGSKTFYVDWITDNGDVLYHSVSPIIDGLTNGQFEIPGNYAGNYIHVRAYTKWMLNFDTAFLYSKDIRILNSNPNNAKNVKPSFIPSIQFFPEGGDAIADIENKIAFKANDQWGSPISVKGTIIDNTGKTIEPFHSVHDGMGSFLFTPQAGINYTAKWKDEKGSEHTTPLPLVKASGVSMQVSVQGSKRIVALQAGKNSPENLKQLHLIGTISQQMIFKTDVDLSSAISKKIIPTEQLPSGVLTITVFDANWNAIAERITFINNNEYSFNTSLEVQRWGLNKRARNEIQISVPDSLQLANFSVAITDASIETDSSDNIISHLLLTSDIKGNVYNPSYYFSSIADSVAQHLDLVMLTNGWRRFKWEDVVKGKLPVISYPKDTNYLALSGKLYGVAKSQLSGKEIIALLVKERDSSLKMFLEPISSDGTFGDPNIIFFDTLRVYYQLKSKLFASPEAKFMIDRLPAPNYKQWTKNLVGYNPFADTTGNYRHLQFAKESLRLQEIDRGKMMENITVTAKTKPPLQVMDERYASGLFKSSDSYQFDLVNDPSAVAATDIFSYLRGKVAGLQIGPGNPPSLSWRGGTPQVYLDEMPIDNDFISSIPVSDIAYVKVFRPPFLGGSGGGSGAIAVYTRKGSEAKAAPGKGISSNSILGYTPIKQFYAPNYSTFKPGNDQKDIRTTLYWNPVLNTNKKGVATIVFYNNDVTKSFRVIIEGMTKDGLLTHYTQILE